MSNLNEFSLQSTLTVKVLLITQDFPIAQMVKNQLLVQETQVQSLGQEDSPGEGNGNPLQYSCLEKPMDGGAPQAPLFDSRVTKRQTRLSD